MSGRNTALILVIIIIVLGVFAWENRNAAWLAPLLGTSNSANSQHQVGTANYICDANKTIAATYYQGPAPTASADATVPPTPNGSVALVLSDGRSVTLPQTISASGIRYANADESLVFWSKGNTAFITEGKTQSQSFANCLAASNISGQESWQTYAAAALGYTVRYPSGYTLNTSYVNQTLGPGKNIQGIQLVIPATEATGTNLASDSGVSIEQIRNVASCSASLFLSEQVGSTTTVTDNGVTYSVAMSSGAGAGNLYTEYAYAILGTSPCTAVRYFIHSSQIGNYPPGMVKAFDQTALLNEFDGIRRSLVIAH
jgi:membrane-bound inhibitor of C-type lysozyme